MRALAIWMLVLAGCGSGGDFTPVGPKPDPVAIVVHAPEPIITESTARFELDSDYEGATFRVSLDGKIVGTFESPIVLEDLPDGPHQVWFWARTRGGTLGQTTATHVWTVDTTPPTLTVTFPPVRSLTDQGAIAVCGTAVEDGGIVSLLVNGVRATSTDGFRTWRAVVPVNGSGDMAIVAEVLDVAGRRAVDRSRTTRAVALPVELPTEDAAPEDEFELALREKNGEVISVESNCVIAIDPDLGKRREVSGEGRGKGQAFDDIVVMTAVPGKDEVAVFDTKLCRVFTVDIESGDRTIVWERLGASDIPATREGHMTSDGTNVYVQGPRAADLVELSLDGTSRRVIADAGWVQDVVALTFDVDRDCLLAIDGKTGNVYSVDPADGSAEVISKHDAEHPLGFARGIVVAGDFAYAIARDHNGVVEIDLDSGDREFLALSGDGLLGPRAIALNADQDALYVLDHGRPGLVHVDLETGVCRESYWSDHAPRPECVGPIYIDPETREVCVLDGGRCALVGVQPQTGNERVVLDLSKIAPDAVDFAIHPVTGQPVVLERHGIYDFAGGGDSCEPGSESCTVVPPDASAPLGSALALRVERDGQSAIILDSRPHVIDHGWIRQTVRHDEVVRVDLTDGKCTLVAQRPSTAMGATMSVMPRVFHDANSNLLYTGSVNCGPYGSCINATLRLLDIDTGEATTVIGIWKMDATTIYFVGGTTTPPTEFAAMVPDPARQRVYTLDREQGVVGYVDLSKSIPRYHVLSGDLPHYDAATGWTTIPHGHGSPLDRAQGIALDAEAGLLYVTSQDRVIMIDVVGGDRALAAVLE